MEETGFPGKPKNRCVTYGAECEWLRWLDGYLHPPYLRLV